MKIQSTNIKISNSLSLYYVSDIIMRLLNLRILFNVIFFFPFCRKKKIKGPF